MFLSDPCTLTINGICVGATSTDILFHLSARTMFRGYIIYSINTVLLIECCSSQAFRGQNGETCWTYSEAAEVC